MTLLDYYSRKIPEYYHTMYQDGFTPTEIMIAHRREMYKKLFTPKEETEIKITSEVKTK